MRNFIKYILVISVITCSSIIHTSVGHHMCTNNPLLVDNAAWSCIPETICTYAQKIPDNRKVRCGGGKVCCPQRLSSTSTADSDFDKVNKIALRRSCINNPELGNNAAWSCMLETSCEYTSNLTGNWRVICGKRKICCPRPLTATTSPTERDFNKTNDICTNNPSLADNAVWSCTPETSCALAKKIPHYNRVTCGEGKMCCPRRGSPSTSPADNDFNEANRIALKKCAEYAAYRYKNYTISGKLIGDPPIRKSVLDCPQVRPLIVGGKDAFSKEFPHMALLGYDEDVTNRDSWLCDGSLISEQFILTAAHCTNNSHRKLVEWAALGLLSRENFTAGMIGKNLFRIIQRFNHPQYKVGNTEYENNDIALYKLETPITLGPVMRPICIHHEPSLMGNNRGAIITRWVQPGLKISNLLQKATVRNIDKTGQCATDNEYKQLLKKGFDVNRMICGGNAIGKDNICLGDSGGPMQVQKADTWWKCMWVQIGITSMGPSNCEAKIPKIYTRVSAYLPWIQKIVWPTDA